MYLLEDQNKVVEEADEWQLLVLRRALCVFKVVKYEQRDNSFHSRRVVHDKVFSLVIEGGSRANVASPSMV